MTVSSQRKFLCGLAGAALLAGMGVPAANGANPEDRLAGPDRVATSLAASAYGEANTVYLAAPNGIPDAITAGALPGRIVYGDPWGADTNGRVNFLRQMDTHRLAYLGGPGLWGGIPAGLNAAYPPDYRVEAAQIQGTDRYETAALLYDRWVELNHHPRNISVLIANGGSMVDALAAGALDTPILLVQPDGTIPAATLKRLQQGGITQITVLGGTGAIPVATTQQLSKFVSGGTPTPPTTKTSEGNSGPVEVPAADTPKTAENIARWQKTLQNYTELSKPNGEIAQKISASSQWIKFGAEAEKYTRETIEDNRSKFLFKTKQDYSNYGSVAALYNDNKDRANQFLSSLASSGYYGADISLPHNLATFEEVVTKYGDYFGVNYSWLDDTPLANLRESFKLEFDTYLHRGVTPGSWTMAGSVINGTYDYQKWPLGLAPLVFERYQTFWQERLPQYRAAIPKIQAWLNSAGVPAATPAQSDPTNIKRIGGADRFETARLLAQARSKKTLGYNKSPIQQIYLVNGTALADAAVAGSLKNGVVLLINGNSLPEATTLALRDLYASHGAGLRILAVGGTAVVPDQAIDAAKTLVR